MKLNPKAYTAARVLKSLVIAKGNADAAAYFAESQGHWVDRSTVVAALKAVAAGANDFGDAAQDLAASFIESMRDFSVAERLTAKRPVQFRQRVLVNLTGSAAAEVNEGGPIPVILGSWTTTSLLPRRFAGISVASKELANSPDPTAPLALLGDLAGAVADAENLAFCSPAVAGSIFASASNFAASGSTVSAVDTDLKRLIDLIVNADKPGCAFVLSKETATFLALLRGSGGAAAYPDLSPAGGEILGIPALVTKAMADEASPSTRTLGLVSSSEILWASGRVEMETSENAALQMASPTTSSTTPTAANMTSLFQADAVAMRAVREAAWYVKPGASAYITTNY